MTGWPVSSVRGEGLGQGRRDTPARHMEGGRRAAAAVIRPGRRPGAGDPSRLMSRPISRCSGAVFCPAHKASQQI